jgi:branched-chain amino acid transport system permease protein
MSLSLFGLQLLNGVEAGLLLFLIASGLTLIFGIMGVVNFAHGSFYMLGAYLAYALVARTGSFAAALALGLPLMALAGVLLERVAVRFLYKRDHLDQVLFTYGLILVFNELQRALWGSEVHGVPAPPALAFSLPMGDQAYPAYRLFTMAACLALASAMALVIRGTRLGMKVRAGASNREMAQMLGVDAGRLFALVFGAGTALAALAGMLAAPLTTVYPGMGDNVLVLSFVVVVVGGIGSVRGAFLGALLIGLADTFGRVLLPSISSAVVYAVMAAVLILRPQGLVSGRS